MRPHSRQLECVGNRINCDMDSKLRGIRFLDRNGYYNRQ